MSKLDKYQGEDIGFSIKIWKDSTKTELIDLDSLSEIIIYIYTDGCKKAIFSKNEKTNYVLLSRVSSTEYSGIIDSSITKIMSPGSLILEINIAQDEESVTNNKWNLIQKAIVGVLRKSLIKIES